MRYPDAGKLLLRVAFGGMMIPHGVSKLDRLENGFSAIKFADPIGLGQEASLILTILVEIGCSAMIILGVNTRWFLIPLMITMFIAAFVVHGADPFSKKEKALLYLAGYLAIFLLGSGRYSLKDK